MIVIAPIALDNADSYRACLDVVARKRRYLAQVEALPGERIRQFLQDSVAKRAVRLYEKLGFVHEARKKNAMRFDGVYDDALQMRLILS